MRELSWRFRSFPLLSSERSRHLAVCTKTGMAFLNALWITTVTSKTFSDTTEDEHMSSITQN